MIRTGRTWNLWAARRESGSLWYVGAKRWVELHGSKDPTVPVLVEEILGDDYAPEVTHYGWEYAEGNYAHLSAQHPSMIHVRTGADPSRAKMFLDMCFPYGLHTSVERGEGRVVAMRITVVPAEEHRP